MPGVPVFGQAVQAPMESAPKAVLRVSVSQVTPSPTAAATAKANNDPKNNRTVQSRQRAMMGKAKRLAINQLPETAPGSRAEASAPFGSATGAPSPSTEDTLIGGSALRASSIPPP